MLLQMKFNVWRCLIDFAIGLSAIFAVASIITCADMSGFMKGKTFKISKPKLCEPHIAVNAAAALEREGATVKMVESDNPIQDVLSDGVDLAIGVPEKNAIRVTSGLSYMKIGDSCVVYKKNDTGPRLAHTIQSWLDERGWNAPRIPVNITLKNKEQINEDNQVLRNQYSYHRRDRRHIVSSYAD